MNAPECVLRAKREHQAGNYSVALVYLNSALHEYLYTSMMPVTHEQVQYVQHWRFKCYRDIRRMCTKSMCA